MARGAHLLVKDMDSRAANRFGELLVGDPSGVVSHKKLEFDVTHVGVQHTLISISAYIGARLLYGLHECRQQGSSLSGPRAHSGVY